MNNQTNVDQNTSSVMTAIQQVDQHIQALTTIQIVGGFDGSQQMQAALTAYQQAILGWPNVKGQITGAMQNIVLSASKVEWVETLSKTIPDATILQESMRALKMVVDALDSSIQSADNALQNFEQDIDKTYRDNADARNEAQEAIKKEDQELDKEEKEYQDDLDDANSISTGLLTVVTAGIYGGYTLYELHEKMEDVESMEDQVAADQQAFSSACSAMDQAKGSVKLTSHALDALNTSVQQSVNQLDDICTTTNPNLHVMRTFIKVFVEEYTAAAKKLDSNFQPDDPNDDLDDLLDDGKDVIGKIFDGF